MKNIVVFGATGNIGIYLVDHLVSTLSKVDYQIIAVGRKKTNLFESMNVPYYQIDITDKKQFDKLELKDVYGVINLAGLLPAYSKDIDFIKYVNVNIIGSLNILEFARTHKAECFLYTQTWSDLAGYWGEETVLHPYMPRKVCYDGDHAFYSLSKCFVVDSMELYHHQFGIRNFVFRLPNIYLYSPEKTYYVDGVNRPISYRYLIDRASQGKDIEIWGNPKAFKDIIYVKDLCEMMRLALLSNLDGGIYNAGTGVKTTLEEQIRGIIEVFCPKNKRSKVVYRPEKQSFPSFVMDIENAKKELGYKPKYLYLDYLKDYKDEQEKRRFDSLWQ